jgi:hypothetical protein
MARHDMAPARPLPLLRHFQRFGGMLARHGVPVSPGSLIDLCRGLAVVNLGNRHDVHCAARSILVSRREHLEIFDHVFAQFWDSAVFEQNPRSANSAATEDGEKAEPHGRKQPRCEVDGGRSGPEGENTRAEPDCSEYSDVEVVRKKDFAALSAAETQQARKLIVTLVRRFLSYRGRRRVSGKDGAIPDFRRLFRRGGPCGLPPEGIRFLERKARRPRLVLLCDVSGSMEKYSSFLIQFMCSLRMELARVEIGVFATRLMMVTGILDRRRLSRSLQELARRVTIWGSGTNIGASVREFNDSRLGRNLHHKTIVIILSDGWERGETDLLSEQMRRLHATAWKVIWLNPLLGRDNYEPICKGMRAALPHIDYFLAAHNVASLEQVGRVIRTAAR